MGKRKRWCERECVLSVCSGLSLEPGRPGLRPQEARSVAPAWLSSLQGQVCRIWRVLVWLAPWLSPGCGLWAPSLASLTGLPSPGASQASVTLGPWTAQGQGGVHLGTRHPTQSLVPSVNSCMNATSYPEVLMMSLEGARNLWSSPLTLIHIDNISNNPPGHLTCHLYCLVWLHL